ncbi:hypothetical protein FB45DRAFT_921257 [Roridomyces roridus]|uniref:Uncharacterized protein n=1 Tax=Roridomyces roridus TaxID=1738132 RepID=A0AAD7FJA4_9AGAR|nr:hypothetical protein FB45DRAFT_921257 [Roridomyces roridus]
MNPTTTPTSTSTSSRSGGIASKIKGAAQVIHGTGENIRGTILGGVDTVVHKDATTLSENDVIAAKGRQQTAEGLDNLRGGATYDNSQHDPRGIPAYDGPGNLMQSSARNQRPVGEPQHHRENAVDMDL